MLEWFIIAMVYFKDTERVEIKKMELPFESQQKCKDYLASTPNIVNDILILQPTSPLRRLEDIDGIFDQRSKFNSESAVSLTLSKKPCDIFFQLDKNMKIFSSKETLSFKPRQEYQKRF